MIATSRQDAARCPQCEEPIDVLDACQECIEHAIRITYSPKGITHCRRGHEYRPETTGVTATEKETRRYCLICKREREHARREADRNRKRTKYREQIRV